MIRPRLTFFLVCSAGLLLLSACASNSGEDDGDYALTSAEIQAMASEVGAKGYVELETMLADGKVTKDEYWEGIQNLQRCIEDRGLGFSEPQLSPVTGITYEFVYNTNGHDEQQASADFTECEERYVGAGFLDQAYRDTHAQVMDPALRSAVLACMTSAGKPGIAEGSNLAEIAPMNDEDDALREVAIQCTVDEAQRLFPEIPSITVQG